MSITNLESLRKGLDNLNIPFENKYDIERKNYDVLVINTSLNCFKEDEDIQIYHYGYILKREKNIWYYCSEKNQIILKKELVIDTVIDNIYKIPHRIVSISNKDPTQEPIYIDIYDMWICNKIKQIKKDDSPLEGKDCIIYSQYIEYLLNIIDSILNVTKLEDNVNPTSTLGTFIKFKSYKSCLKVFARLLKRIEDNPIFHINHIIPYEMETINSVFENQNSLLQ